MNATLQQLFAVPSFRDGLLASSPPAGQRTPLFSELQRTFAHLRDGMRPTYDPKALVHACSALSMQSDPFQQNDAAEFLTLLVDYCEEALKGTRDAQLLRDCFGGKMLNQVLWEEPRADGGGSVRKVSETEEAFVTLTLEVKLSLIHI